MLIEYYKLNEAMEHSLIDKKTQRVRFGYWPFQDCIKTTLKLVSLENGNFDIHYSSKLKEIGTGVIGDVNIPTDGIITKKINNNPEIKVEIFNCSPTDFYRAIQVTISAEILGLGNRIIYNQILMDQDIRSKKIEYSFS